MATAKNIVELRELLARKFPGVRMTAEAAPSIAKRYATGVPQLDQLLGGGLPKGGMTEIVTPGVASGAMLLMVKLLQQARSGGEWLALVDASDSFDPGALDNDTLERLLWVRCGNPREAVKAADLLLHDGTLALVALDLSFSHPKLLRKVPSSTWFRLQRILERSSTAFLVITPDHLVTNADARLTLARRFDLDSLEQDRAALIARIEPAESEAASGRISRSA